MKKPEPPATDLPRNMQKEQEYWLHVYDSVPTPQPVKPVDIDYSTLVQYHGK